MIGVSLALDYRGAGRLRAASVGQWFVHPDAIFSYGGKNKDKVEDYCRVNLDTALIGSAKISRKRLAGHWMMHR
jgi:hypothetical protein